jgi:hypothetical protein
LAAHLVEAFDILLASALAVVFRIDCLFINGLASQVRQPCLNVSLGDYKTDLFILPSEWNASVGADRHQRLHTIFNG